MCQLLSHQMKIGFYGAFWRCKNVVLRKKQFSKIIRQIANLQWLELPSTICFTFLLLFHLLGCRFFCFSCSAKLFLPFCAFPVTQSFSAVVPFHQQRFCHFTQLSPSHCYFENFTLQTTHIKFRNSIYCCKVYFIFGNKFFFWAFLPN